MRAARTATASRSGSVLSPMTRLSGLAATALTAAAAPERRSYQPPGHVVLSAPSMSTSARVASSASVTCASWPIAVRDDGDTAKLERYGHRRSHHRGSGNAPLAAQQAGHFPTLNALVPP